jgi:type II secretory pathway pseudopilin PulG
MKFRHLRRLPAFSLIEVSIVLIIIGLITTAVFKGQELIESARIQATLDAMNQIKLSVLRYRDQYGQWPGNDARAQEHFGNGVANGNGQGVIQGQEAAQAWLHLKADGLVDSSQPPVCKLGGHLIFVGNPQAQGENCLAISRSPEALTAALTPKQAMLLKAKAGEPLPGEGQFLVQAAPGVQANDCHNGQAYTLQNKAPACVVLLKLF